MYSNMKKLLVRIIHFISPSYFPNKSYDQLDAWGIEDVVDGKIYFI